MAPKGTAPMPPWKSSQTDDGGEKRGLTRNRHSFYESARPITFTVEQPEARLTTDVPRPRVFMSLRSAAADPAGVDGSPVNKWEMSVHATVASSSPKDSFPLRPV